MAAKSKLLIRELKTIKADLAFARDRSSQLESENKILRENSSKDRLEDEDLVDCFIVLHFFDSFINLT